MQPPTHAKTHVHQLIFIMSGFRYAFSLSKDEARMATPPGTLLLIGTVTSIVRYKNLLISQNRSYRNSVRLFRGCPSTCSTAFHQPSRSSQPPKMEEDCHIVLHVTFRILSKLLQLLNLKRPPCVCVLACSWNAPTVPFRVE